jgi:hypothetical protein
MNSIAEDGGKFRHLRRSAVIGYVATFAWYGTVGGYMSIQDGESFGWFSIALALGLLVLPFTSPFRSILGTIASHRAFPKLIFLPNMFLVIMYGYFTSLYLRDPFLTYNDMDTLAAVLFGGATALAAASLIANTVSYFIDVRE